MGVNLSQEQIGGIKQKKFQGYGEIIQGLASKLADHVKTVPHRRLTYLEAASVEESFMTTEGYFRKDIDALFDILPRSVETKVSDLLFSFAEACATMAYLAGQRDGFRYGAAAVTRAVQDPAMALHVMGALVDDRQLDRLTGQFATGNEDPEYVDVLQADHSSTAVVAPTESPAVWPSTDREVGQDAGASN